MNNKCTWLTSHPVSLPTQLVYKVKLDFVLEQLASASVGGYGQDVWSDLVEEAKTNLMKIMVSVMGGGVYIYITKQAVSQLTFLNIQEYKHWIYKQIDFKMGMV